jgi:hypothetical protein
MKISIVFLLRRRPEKSPTKVDNVRKASANKCLAMPKRPDEPVGQKSRLVGEQIQGKFAHPADQGIQAIGHGAAGPDDIT